MRTIRVSDLPDTFPVKKSTLYVWKHKGLFPGLFVKIGGVLLLDLDKWYELLKHHRTVKATLRRKGFELKSHD